MATSSEIKEAIIKILPQFGVEELKAVQMIILNCLISREDCLAVLPTGFGKSLPFQMSIPVQRQLHIIVIGKIILCCSLVSIMKDQFERLQKIPNLKAAHIGSSSDISEGMKDVNIFYASPETLIGALQPIATWESKFDEAGSGLEQVGDDNLTTVTKDADKFLSVSFDGAWQKRGSGRCYNSKTGHATIIGKESGKCLDYGVKSSDCRKCLFTDDSSDHDCRKNYAGSAKSMESAIAVDIVSHVMELGYRIQSITMDDDTTTISRLKSTVDPEIKKLSDKNHIKKNISNSLYNIKKGYKTLTSSTISYFVKCASYAISQNSDNAELLKTNLAAIVPHAFGKHDNCNASWCGYMKNPDTYKHSGLTGGCDLSDQSLQKDLETVFNRMADNSDKLTQCGSSQANESLNFIITTKAPKFKHFGGSESLRRRVRCWW